MANAKRPIELDELVVYRKDLIAGVLKRTERGCLFQYAPEFLAHLDYQGLSYRMKKSPIPLSIQGVNLPTFFAGLLPEGLRLKALIKNVKTSEDDLFTLFAASGSHVIGDVYAKTASVAHDKKPAPPKLRDIDFYDYFQEILGKNTYASGEDTLAGVQEKISASMISFPLNIAKETKSYILKLNPKDKPSLIENELSTMTLAAKCGITTAKVKLVRDKNKNLGLLVERFDRVWNEGKKAFALIHQEDACQFSDRYPADKYKLSFAEIVKNAAEIATAPQPTVLKLMRLYCFSYLVGNGDLHAKNISLFTAEDSGIIDLTPAYDLISTFVYGDQKMALKLDGKDDSITKKMVIQFGERFKVKAPATEKMLDRLVSDVKRHAHILESLPVEKKKQSALQQMMKRRLKDFS
jgi:serine/threonine-protein kinase HipA